MANIWGNAGDVSGEFENNKIMFKRAAPGTFFAIAGAVIVVVTILRGFEVEPTSSDKHATGSFETPPHLPTTSPLTKE